MYVCVCTVLKPKIPRYYSPTFWPRVARFLLSSVAGNGIIIILLCTVQTQDKREKQQSENCSVCLPSHPPLNVHFFGCLTSDMTDKKKKRKKSKKDFSLFSVIFFLSLVPLKIPCFPSVCTTLSLLTDDVKRDTQNDIVEIK